MIDVVGIPKTFKEFFIWCEEQGIYRTRDIARAFGRTPQTIENWRKKSSDINNVLPIHVGLSCTGYEAMRLETGLLEPVNTPWTLHLLDIWRNYHGLTTMEKTAEIFGLSRQAIHNWYVRERLPNWLNLACHGYAYQKNYYSELKN